MLRKLGSLVAVHVWRTNQHRRVSLAWKLKGVLQMKISISIDCLLFFDLKNYTDVNGIINTVT